MISNDTKKTLSIFRKIINRVNDQKRICQSPGCANDAINSHLLQRNGVLSHISENAHLIQIKPNDFFKIEKEGMIQFQRVGINQAISYPLFCNYHDTSIFTEIESSSIDFLNYRSQLLFSYRSLCAELRKKERNVDIAKSVINSNILSQLLSKTFFDNERMSLKGNQLAVDDLSSYKEELEIELKNPEGTFYFETLVFPPYKVSISAVFSYVDNLKNILNRYSDSAPLNTVFFNVVPQPHNLYVIMGYKRDKTDEWILNYINKWNSCDPENVGLLLSDLVTRVETWAMAQSVYSNISTTDLQRFKAYFLNSLNSGIDNRDLYGDNLFKVN